jgi:hypothetical protein
MTMLAWLLSALLARKSENRFRSLVIAGLVLFGWPVVSRWALDKWRNFGEIVPEPAVQTVKVEPRTTPDGWVEWEHSSAVPDQPRP